MCYECTALHYTVKIVTGHLVLLLPASTKLCNPNGLNKDETALHSMWWVSQTSTFRFLISIHQTYFIDSYKCRYFPDAQ